MQDRSSMRLLPVVMLAIAALIVFKVAEHTLSQDPSAGGARAQEAENPAGAADPAAEEEVLDPEVTGTFERDDDGGDGPGENAVREFTAAEREVLESLLARRQQLDEREREVQLREKLLEAAEKRVEERISELKVIEARIEQSFGKQEEERKARLQSLVGMYENMKPKEAARIFDRLDMTVLIGVVQQMKMRKMAPILAKMDATVAQRLTVELAKLAAQRVSQ